jgi:phosphatidylglycerophosphate synthase
VTVSERSDVAERSNAPAMGLVGQLAVLAALAATVGLGTAGWLAGAFAAATTWVLLDRAVHTAGTHRWGPADTVTLTRLTLAVGVAALATDAVLAGRPAPFALTVLAGVALLLDAVDGQVARRTGTSSALGARFDMESDSFLVLVLSVVVATALGWWVVAIGAFRYVFVVLTWAFPWLRAPLPPRMSRKVVAAAQGVVLVVASAGLAPAPLMALVVAGALGSLVWSFGTDVAWTWRQAGPAGRALPVRPQPALSER